MRGGIVSIYPFVWKLGNTLIQMTKIHLGIPIMSDIKNTEEAVIKACDKGLFGI
jgi:hypothetical protein